VAAVFAGSEVRTIHVFPTGVSSEGWTKEHLALEQVLGPQAIFTDFTRDNSAFVIMAEGDDGTSGGRVDSEEDGQGAWGEDELPADSLQVSGGRDDEGVADSDEQDAESSNLIPESSEAPHPNPLPQGEGDVTTDVETDVYAETADQEQSTDNPDAPHPSPLPEGEGGDASLQATSYKLQAVVYYTHARPIRFFGTSRHTLYLTFRGS
jgi:hypothetical protein